LVLFPTKGIDKLKFVICNQNNKKAKKKKKNTEKRILKNLGTIHTHKLGRDEVAGPVWR
jgi:hypothetical protein